LILSVVGALILIFIIGLLQGATLCNITCGPLILMRIGGTGGGWRRGLRLSLSFSAPRLVLLTLLGFLLGAVGYGASRTLDPEPFVWFSPAVYIVIGLITIANGVHFLRGNDKGHRTCAGQRSAALKRLVTRLVPRKGGSESRALFAIGLLISVVCFGEAWLISVALSPGLGATSSSYLLGALYGGMAMLLFSIGISLPLILISTLASEFGKRYDISPLLKGGGLVLIVLGSFLVLFEMYAILITV